jgi:hypothetical protein
VKRLFRTSQTLLAVLASVGGLANYAFSQSTSDPHRPACTTAICRKVKSFARARYCGASPFGNGPDDGCELKKIIKPQAGVDVIADYECKWNESKQNAECEQHGEPSRDIRSILIQQLARLGTPANAPGQTYFTVWKSAHSGWSLAAAYYSRPADSDVEICEVIGVIDQRSRMITLRKVPFQKTDQDVPTVVEWVPLDLADANGDGTEDIILEGDAYEDHWLEVVSVKGWSAETIFSGLGYYL